MSAASYRLKRTSTSRTSQILFDGIGYDKAGCLPQRRQFFPTPTANAMAIKLTFFSFALSLSALLLSYGNVTAMPFSAGRSTLPYDSALDLKSRVISSSKSVIIQMFQWDWDSVASECSTFIGPAGYGYVQGLYTQQFRWLG